MWNVLGANELETRLSKEMELLSAIGKPVMAERGTASQTIYEHIFALILKLSRLP